MLTIDMDFPEGLFLRRSIMTETQERSLSEAHTHDHRTLITRGIVKVYCDNQITVYDASKKTQFVNIEASKEHWFEVIEGPVEWICIHPLDSEDIQLTGDRSQDFDAHHKRAGNTLVRNNQ